MLSSQQSFSEWSDEQPTNSDCSLWLHCVTVCASVLFGRNNDFLPWLKPVVSQENIGLQQRSSNMLGFWISRRNYVGVVLFCRR